MMYVTRHAIHYEHYDALEDADHDGLTNKQEYDNGTMLRVADSDGDGIKDGEEVKTGDDGYITNPLLADSDGDGIRDGLEIQTGSDPTNSASINLALAISRLEVTPFNFILIYNTIIGETTRQLTVTGVLTDGTRIDLTSSARGTNYNSSDLTVANFGATDGLIYAGQNGVALITVSNSGFNAFSYATVRAFSPTALSYITIPGYANNVDVNNNYAYVAAGSAGLQIVDVSNPNSPHITGSRDTPGTAIDVRVAGNLAYIADGGTGLQIMDISNPASPVIIGSIDTPGIAQDIVVSGTRAFVADGSSGLSIIDISTPSVPAILGAVNIAGAARGVAVRDNTALVVDDSTLKVIDFSTVSLPQIVGTVNIPGTPKDLTVRDNLAYVSALNGGLQIADFSNLSSPIIVGSLPTQFVPRDVELWGQFAFFAEQVFPNAIAIADITESTNPIFRAILDLSGLGDYAGTGIGLTNNYAFVTEEAYIVGPDYGVTGNTRLFIGQYAELNDNGTTPPQVSITSPLNGAEVYEGSIIPISVSASDDVIVGSVSVLIDGEVKAADNTPLFQFNYNVPMSITSLAIGASALDLANNMGTAENVFITVIPDPPPTVNITSHTNGGSVIEDDTIIITAGTTDNAGVTLLEFIVDGQVVSSDTTAPFKTQYHVPAGSVSLRLGARATDTVGHKVNAEEVVVNVIPNTSPEVSITNPVSGAVVIEGIPLVLSASATDDVSITSVIFLVDGSVTSIDSTAPYQVVYHVPVGVTGIVIKAEALDNSGHTGVSDEINITVIPDPGTTVTGRVVDKTGQPIAGADVTTFSLHSVSDNNGLFSISGVPTVQGNIAVTATAVINGETLQGTSAVISPVPNGITDVGDVFISNIGPPWAWGNNRYG